MEAYKQEFIDFMSIFLNSLFITVFTFIVTKFKITLPFFATISTFAHTKSLDNFQISIQQLHI